MSKRNNEDQDSSVESKKLKVEEITEEKKEENTNQNEVEKEEMSEEDEPKSEAKGESKQKDKKKKAVVILGYCGLDYQGLQRNPGAKAIEDDLEDALYKAGAISSENYKKLNKIGWHRGCRTDKGVHAAGNIISAKLVIDDGLKDRVNSLLPPAIRIFGIHRVLGQFVAKNAIDYRVYEYILPTTGLVPIVKGNDAKFDEEMLQNFRKNLALYEGTHNFHNFTPGKKFEDPSSYRFMKTVQCSDPFEMEGVQVVKVSIKGQSFMLNQIRKMIGLVVLAARHSAHENVIKNSMGPLELSIPMAPGEFLLLDRCAFNSYNRKLDNLKSPNPKIKIEEIKEVEEFKKNYLYPTLMKVEKEKSIMKTFVSKVDLFKPFVDKKEKDLYIFLKEASVLFEGTLKCIEKEKSKKSFKFSNPDWE